MLLALKCLNLSGPLQLCRFGVIQCFSMKFGHINIDLPLSVSIKLRGGIVQCQ